MPSVRCNVGLNGLCQRQDDVGAVLGVAQKRLVVGIAEIACLEQYRWSTGSAKHMESGKAMRFRTKLEPPR